MSGAKRGIEAQVARWLQFAQELGIDGLGVTLVNRRRGAAPQPGSIAPAAIRPAEVRSRSAQQVSQPPGPGPGANPFDRIRAAVGSGSAASPPTGRVTVPKVATIPGGTPTSTSVPSASSASSAPSASSASSAPSASSVVRRLTAVSADRLVVPGDGPATVPLPADLAGVRAHIGDCQRCRLHEQRTTIVFGVGDPAAELMFVGEGPGADEDRQGEPFVGRAGQLLNDIIKAIGLRREQVYIANVVKCRPPENRTPEPDETGSCSGFLFRQLAIVRPKVVVALGRPAAATLLGRTVSIGRIRGQVFDLFGASLVPTYHPAYLLRNPADKRAVWEDMKLVRDLLNGRRAADGSAIEA